MNFLNQESSHIMKRSQVVFTLLILFSIKLMFAQNNMEAQLVALMQQEHVPGAQIVHVKDGRTNSYDLGEKKYQSGDKVTDKSLFQAASMTKVVAAYAFLRLLDKGVFELDKPLSDYWEYDRLKDDPYVNEVTARMVLNHTTGLPNWSRNKPLEIGFKPGTSYRYSGEGFFYLQQVLEHLTGKLLEEIVNEEVFVPFNMKESSLLYDDEKEELYAYGHAGLDGLEPSVKREFRRENAAYTLLTTASDYTKFVQKCLLEGKGLKPETLQRMLTPSSKMKPNDDHDAIEFNKHLSFGLGVLLQENELGKQIIHTGSNSGRYLAIFMAYPKTMESLVVLTNSSNGKEFREKVARLLLDEQTFWVFER